MPDTPMTPDLDAIRERLEDVYRPTCGLIAWSEVHGLHFMVTTSDIGSERGVRLVQAIAAAPTDVAALMAWGEHLAAEVKRLRAHIGLVEAQRDQVWAVKERLAAVVEHDVLGLLAEVTRLRPMEAALAAVLRQFTEKGHPGEPCLRTGWVPTRTVKGWRAALDGGAS